jgi:hypothetical protein
VFPVPLKKLPSLWTPTYFVATTGLSTQVVKKYGSSVPNMLNYFDKIRKSLPYKGNNVGY